MSALGPAALGQGERGQAFVTYESLVWAERAHIDAFTDALHRESAARGLTVTITDQPEHSRYRVYWEPGPTQVRVAQSEG